MWMSRKTISALLVVAVMLVSGPALTATATTAGHDDATTAKTVVVHNAQVQTVQLNNSTVENVTIRVLRIDRMTIQNQTDGQLNETLGGEGDEPIVLRSVHFRNLTLQNASATGLNVSGQPQAIENVGNVSSVVIAEMNVDHLEAQQANVSEGGGGGLIGGLIERVRGLFGGGGEQAGNQTVVQPDLRIGAVNTSQLTVQQLNLEQVERVEPGEMAANETAGNETAGNATTPQNETGGAMGPQAGGGGAAPPTTIGRITVENASIGTLSADAMVFQQSEQQAGENETQTPSANETQAPAANETSPTPG